jgi:hypothetical protein
MTSRNTSYKSGPTIHHFLHSPFNLSHVLVQILRSLSLPLSLYLSTDTHIYGHALLVSHSVSIPDVITFHHYVIHIHNIPLSV